MGAKSQRSEKDQQQHIAWGGSESDVQPTRRAQSGEHERDQQAGAHRRWNVPALDPRHRPIDAFAELDGHERGKQRPDP